MKKRGSEGVNRMAFGRLCRPFDASLMDRSGEVRVQAAAQPHSLNLGCDSCLCSFCSTSWSSSGIQLRGKCISHPELSAKCKRA